MKNLILLSSDGRLYFSSHYKNSEKIEQKTESLSFDEDGLKCLEQLLSIPWE